MFDGLLASGEPIYNIESSIVCTVDLRYNMHTHYKNYMWYYIKIFK